MRNGLIAEIRLFLIIFIVAFVAVYIVFNATSMVAQVSYALDDKEEKVVHLLPVVEFEDTIYIPKTKTLAPIVVENSDDENVLLASLNRGVLLFPGSVEPGQNGSTVLLGHSSASIWSGGEYKSVFSLLNKLDKRDVIKVYFDNEEFVYRVSQVNIFSVEKANEVVTNSSGPNTLFLSSCWPLGTPWNRIVVTAILVN
jgi:LPXTG-site transpeptidase (sortase) family protein